VSVDKLHAGHRLQQSDLVGLSGVCTEVEVVRKQCLVVLRLTREAKQHCYSQQEDKHAAKKGEESANNRLVAIFAAHVELHRQASLVSRLTKVKHSLHF